MLDARPAVLRDERVDRVRRLQVGEIGPGAEDAQRAQLAPMLVRHEIVRIVRACAGVQVAAENLARDQAPRNDAVGAVLVARHSLEYDVEIVLDERRPLAVRAPNRGLRIDRRLLRIVRGEVRLHLVVAQRPEDLGGDRHGGGGAFRERRRIELEEPGLALPIHSREARVRAGGLFPDNDPLRRVRRRADVRAAGDLLGRDRRGADAVGEPARVGHLVDRVDVLRSQAARRVAGRDEQVVDQLVHLRLAVRRRFRGILRFGRASDRIVRVEPRTLRRGARGEQCDGADRREEREAASPWLKHWHEHDHVPQKEADDAKMTEMRLSRLVANSTRSGVANGPWKRRPSPRSSFRSSKSRSFVRAATLPVS